MDHHTPERFTLVTIERSREVFAGLKEAGVNLIASVPDIDLLEPVTLLSD